MFIILSVLDRNGSLWHIRKLGAVAAIPFVPCFWVSGICVKSRALCSELLTRDAEYEGAGDHEDRLDGVSPDDGRQSAEDGEEGGHQQQHDDGQVQAQVTLPLHRPLDEQRSGVQVRLRRRSARGARVRSSVGSNQRADGVGS